MPQTQSKQKLNKISKLKYRNPIYLAREWQQDLSDGKYRTQADLSRALKVSRARVTQVLNLLKLPKGIFDRAYAMGDPLPKPIVTEHSLRQFGKDDR
jgi:hypothetical protein